MAELEHRMAQTEVGITDPGTHTDNGETESPEGGGDQEESPERIDPEDHTPLPGRPSSRSSSPSGHSSDFLFSSSDHSSGGSLSLSGHSSSGSSTISETYQEREPEEYAAVEVLLLTFEYSDLDLSAETEEVRRAFSDLGYKVTRYKIKMRESLHRLKNTLKTVLERNNERNLLIIYYHGHGGLVEGNKFAFASHNYPESTHELWNTMLDLFKNNDTLSDVNGYLRNRNERYQPITVIRWEDISEDIMTAKCDTLIILDCCNAGLAAVRGLGNEDHQDEGNHNDDDDDGEDIRDSDVDLESKENNTADDENNPGGNQLLKGRPAEGTEQPAERTERQEEGNEQQGNEGNQANEANHLEKRKELIGACGWGVSTTDHMSPAMCRVLRRLRDPYSNMSTFRLVHEMNNILVRECVRPPAGKFSEDVPQAVHYVLRHRRRQPRSAPRIRAGKIVLRRMER